MICARLAGGAGPPALTKRTHAAWTPRIGAKSVTAAGFPAGCDQVASRIRGVHVIGTKLFVREFDPRQAICEAAPQRPARASNDLSDHRISRSHDQTRRTFSGNTMPCRTSTRSLRYAVADKY